VKEKGRERERRERKERRESGERKERRESGERERERERRERERERERAVESAGALFLSVHPCSHHVKLAGEESRRRDLAALVVRTADVECICDSNDLLHPLMSQSIHATHHNICPGRSVCDSGATDFEGFQLLRFAIDSIQVDLPCVDAVDSSTAIVFV